MPRKAIIPAIVFALVMLVTPPLALAEHEVSFVASHEELTTAIEEGASIRGLAVSADFYKSVTGESQELIDELIFNVIEMRLRPVILYGNNLDATLVQKLLGEKRAGCKPLRLVGVFPTWRPDRTKAAISFCAGSSALRDEQSFRKKILTQWLATKKSLQGLGYQMLGY